MLSVDVNLIPSTWFYGAKCSRLGTASSLTFIQHNAPDVPEHTLTSSPQSKYCCFLGERERANCAREGSQDAAVVMPSTQLRLVIPSTSLHFKKLVRAAMSTCLLGNVSPGR